MHIHHKALGSFQYTAAGIVLAFSVHVRHILAETWTEFILQKYGLLGTIVEVVVVQARNSISSQDQTYINERFFSDSKCSKKNNFNLTIVKPIFLKLLLQLYLGYYIGATRALEV